LSPEPARPRTLLRVVSRLCLGGPAWHVLRLDAPLRRAGWRSVVVTGRPGPGEGDLVGRARARGLDVRVLPTLGRAVDPAADLRALASLRGLVRVLRPDLVHTHTAKAGALGRAAVPARARGPALVHTFHGHVLSGNFGRLASSAFAALERRLARRTGCLVAVAPRVRDELLHRHGVGRAGQWVVVPPGYDPGRTRPDPAAGRAWRARLGVSPDEVLAGVVGRLAPVKRVRWALDALGELPGVRLVVVGDGPRAAALRAAADPRVLFEPPRETLHEVWGALDLLALPSRQEGLPQVLVEALAAGVPAVATAVGGVPDLLRDGRDGLLVPPDDEEAFGRAARRLARDADLRARLGTAGRERDLSDHGAEAVAAALTAVYEDALAVAAAAA